MTVMNNKEATELVRRLPETLATLREYIEKLERENAVLRADRDRLDWLEGEDGQSWTAKWYYWGDEWINRAAIDAARKEAKP
jgi:hypothetical protein